MAAEDRFERAQQRRPLFHPRGAKRHPSVSPTANPTEVWTHSFAKTGAALSSVRRSDENSRGKVDK
jgi:hypothetical protein